MSPGVVGCCSVSGFFLWYWCWFRFLLAGVRFDQGGRLTGLPFSVFVRVGIKSSPLVLILFVCRLSSSGGFPCYSVSAGSGFFLRACGSIEEVIWQSFRCLCSFSWGLFGRLWYLLFLCVTCPPHPVRVERFVFRCWCLLSCFLLHFHSGFLYH